MSERWPGLLTREEAAEYLGCSPSTVSREKAAGRIKSVLLRGAVKYSREALDAFIRDLPEGDGHCAANEARAARIEDERLAKREQSRAKRIEQSAPNQSASEG